MDNGKIINVNQEIVSESLYRFFWETDNGYFGEINCFYTGDGRWVIDSEFMGIEFISKVLSFYYENQSKNIIKL